MQAKSCLVSGILLAKFQEHSSLKADTDCIRLTLTGYDMMTDVLIDRQLERRTWQIRYINIIIVVDHNVYDNTYSILCFFNIFSNILSCLHSKPTVVTGSGHHGSRLTGG